MNKFLFYKKENFFINILLIFLAFIQFILFIGLDNADIHQYNWLFFFDTAADLVNWIKFKNSEWFFPVGLFSNGELGNSSIAYTGAVPFLSIILKFFFKNFNNFQYFGLWIFLCFYLQLLFSYLILFEITKNSFFSIIGGLLFMISPIMFNKIGFHLSLSGHWIILAFFYNKVLCSKKYYLEKNIFIICFSSLIHFYFTLMLLLIDLIQTFFDYARKKKIIFRYIKYCFLLFIPLIITMYLVGYFEIPIQDTLGGGYGTYKMNILSIINPIGQNQYNSFNWSNFLPTLEANYGEHEGFNYLGFGTIILILISIYYFFSDNAHKINLSFVFIILILICFSLSNKIDFGNINLIEIKLDKKIEALLSIGRASGRFFWPVYYFLMLFSLIIIYKKFLQKSIYIVLILLTVQLADIQPGLKKYINANSFNKIVKKQENEIWKKINKENIIISSTYTTNSGADFFRTLDLQIKNRNETEIINLARYNRKKLISLRYENYKNFFNKKIDNKKLYLINNYGHLNHLKYLLKDSKEYSFLYRDNIWILFNKDKIRGEIENSDSFEKIKSKKILEEVKYSPKFIDGSFDQTFLGLGWTKHREDLAVTDGKKTSLIFDFSDLKDQKYILQFNISPYILKNNQELIVEMNNQKYLIKDKKEKNLFLDIDLVKIKDLNNFVVNFKIKGQITEFSIFKSPDIKKMGFKLNYIKLNKI